MAHYIDKSDLVAEIKRRKGMCDNHYGDYWNGCYNTFTDILSFINALVVKEVGVWKTVDNINPPQADRNKIYCVFTKDRYILATVINHPQDEDLLQWKCTEFPFHRYDMYEGDKYMQIV